MEATISSTYLKTIGALSSTIFGSSFEENILLFSSEKKSGKINVEGSGEGAFMLASFDATVKEDGSFAIDPKIFSKLRPDISVKIKASKDNIKIRFGNTTSTLGIVEPPTITKPKMLGGSAKMPAKLLKEAIDSVAFDPKYKGLKLTLQVSIDNGSLDVAGMDSYVMAHVRTTKRKDIKCKNNIAFVLEGKTIQRILKFVEDDEIISVASKTGKFLQIKTREFFVQIPLIEVPYTDVEKHKKTLAKKHPVKASMVIEKEDLERALSDATIFGRKDDTFKVKFNIAPKAFIAFEGSGVNSKTKIGGIKVKGKDEAVIHVEYLSELVNLIPHGQVRIESWGTLAFALISMEIKNGTMEYLLSKVATS